MLSLTMEAFASTSSAHASVFFAREGELAFDSRKFEFNIFHSCRPTMYAEENDANDDGDH